MAAQANSKTVQVEEEIEGDRILTSDFFFSEIGKAVPIFSNGSSFDIQNPPRKPLVVSERFGLIFAAHSSGFCVAKTKDVIASAKEIKDKGSAPSVQALSVADVQLGRVHILALSIDSSVLAVVVGQNVHCFSVNSLLNKDKNPFSSCSVESGHVKDLHWIKDIGASFVVLTDDRKLHVGAPYKPLKDVMEEVDAVGMSFDGNYVAVARKSTLMIYSSKFTEILHILLPLNSWMGEKTASSTIQVDSIRWVRPDSIVVGCFQLTEDSEENYFVQVIKSKENNIVEGSSMVAAVYFSDLFPCIVDDIVPFGRGPHLFVEYLENCEMAFVSNKKNPEEHIMLLAWSQKNNQVSAVDIVEDSWLPRIELQENGDENLVLGLSVDKTSVHENVNVKLGDGEQRELPPHCLLLCVTLEGKLVMFNVASIAGSQSSTKASSSVSSVAEHISAVGPSNVGEVPLEETAKKSAITSASHELSEKKISFGFDETSARKDIETSDVKKYFTCTPNSDESWRKESVDTDSKEKASTDVETCKSGQVGYSLKGTLSQFSLKDSQAKNMSSFGGYTVGAELSKNEQSLVSKLPDFGKSTALPLPSTSPGSLLGLSDGKSSFVSPSVARSTLSSGSVLNSVDTSGNAGNFVGNFSSLPSNRYSSSIGKATNDSQKALVSGGFTGTPLGIPTSKMQSRESVALPNPIGNNSRYAMKENSIKSFPFGQPNSEQESSKQYCNVHNMASELDKLLERVEEGGGFVHGCTTAHRSSLETLEESMKSLSDRCRAWQSFTDERLREVQVLLDKTVQVLAREKHMEGIVRQTTDEHYLDLWNRQKLNCELDLKRQYLLNCSQDLINQMIELEKHFNGFELNLFGESNAVDMSSRAVQCRSTSSRHIQSLHAVHSATISQLAAAQHLSEFLSRQMAVLNVKSPPAKQESLKKKLFESIGMTNPVYYVGSESTGKKVEPSTKKTPLVFSSSAVHKESRRNLLSSSSTHGPESARRRRDSLDRSWANFEAPRTTVKRMLVQNASHNVSSSFSSRESQPTSLGKLEGSTATYPKILPMQDKNGCKDTTIKGYSETVAASMFNGSGAISVTSQVELSPRLLVLPGNNFSAREKNVSSSPFLSLPLPASLVDPNMKDDGNHSTAKGTGAQIGHIDKSVPTFIEDSKSSGHESVQEKSNTQKRQPQVLSSSTTGDYIRTPMTATGGGRSSLIGSAHDAQSPPALGFSASSASTIFSGRSSLIGSAHDAQSPPALGFSASSASAIFAPIVSTRNAQNSITSIEDGSVSSAKTMVKNVGNQGVQRPSSASSVSSICAETSLLSTPQPCQKSEPSPSPPTPSNGLKFEFPTSSSEVKKQEASGSPLPLSTTAKLASDIVQNTQPETTSVAHEDEMEEEAPETNQTVDLSLGSSLGGFGLGGPSPSANTASSRSNPFGGPMTNAPVSVSLTVPSGELFRPASLSFQSLQGPQQSQPSNTGATTVGTFASGNSFPNQQPPTPTPTGSGFGQPGQIGSGQHALGSVLGSFGQSRQFGAQLPSAGFGSGFGGSQPGGGGFLNASTGGGFAGVSATSGGFGGIRATASGFAVAAASAGGFAGAAATGGGFAGAGFGAFSKQGTGGFSAVGPGIGGGGKPASDLFTQIRK